jgi:DNA polymerase-1
LAKQLRIDRVKAKTFINNYFETYPGVKKFIESTIAEARKLGFVTTMLGRRRILADINSPNFNQRMFAERTAINTPVQGTAADLIKVAMVNIQKILTKKELKTKMILQVHDELVFEVPDEEVKTVEKMVKAEMEKAIPLIVPVKVDIGAGQSWGQAKG